ncbi:MAG: hypothetical protein ACFNX0_00155 [Treponema sp.]
MKVQAVLHRTFLKNHIAFELTDDNAIKQRIAAVLSYCKSKHNDYVLLTLESPKRPRSTGAFSQNHHLNGHIMQICNETGNSYEAVKNAVKMIAVEQMEYPYTDFHGVITPKPESECSTEECAKLIEASHILAADLGLILQE